MSNVIIPASVQPERIAQYERMLKVLRASIPDDNHLAKFLTTMEASDPDRKKRDLARELIRYVFDRKYLVKPYV